VSRYLVTRPALPPLERYVDALREVWTTRQLSNGGPFHQQLEADLAAYLDVPYVSLFSNGTAALVAALSVAIPDVAPGDEIITTPYTFVATTQAAMSLGLRPRFVDVAPGSVNLDPRLVASEITPRTRGILPVSCYGMADGLAEIDRIGADRGIPVILDAAHAFGARTGCASVTAFGRMSALSLHATKLFHTGEGGAVVSHTAADHEALRRHRNFGYVDEEDIPETGTNAKMSELSAALGVTLLPRMGDELAARRRLARQYAERLAPIPGLRVLTPVDDDEYNNAYLPIVVEDGAGVTRDGLYAELRERGVFVRRYFHPLVTDFEFLRVRGLGGGGWPHARELSARVLCLPLEGTLQDRDVDAIVDEIRALVAPRVLG
jgi:dTDP-4-amino-4,6-dideoxygalactose transaminase